MKIAVASDDKVNVSEHLGSAPYYVVLEVEGENIIKEGRQFTTRTTTLPSYPLPSREGSIYTFKK